MGVDGNLSTVLSSIKGLGEVNLRVKDLEKMTGFYIDVLGLKPIYESKRHVFLSR
jgi:catechol-2,3-dioxygenase